MQRGDLLPGDTVWLTPRTMTAPAVCYRQPRGSVVRLDDPSYVVVKVDGTEYQVHRDNVRRSNPNSSEPVAHPQVRARKARPDGWEDEPLW
jgi:hypothetical protein